MLSSFGGKRLSTNHQCRHFIQDVHVIWLFSASADSRPMVGRLSSESDSLYAAPQPTVNVVGLWRRSSADRKTLRLIKVIGEVCFNVIAPVGKQKVYLSADKHAKFLLADCLS